MVSRYFQIGGWCFEVASVKGRRCNEHGDPYDAVVDIHLHGQTAYASGMLTANQQRITKIDREAIKEACELLEVTELRAERAGKEKVFKK